MAEPARQIEPMQAVVRPVIRHCSWPGCARVTVARHCSSHRPPAAAGATIPAVRVYPTQKAAAMARSRERAEKGLLAIAGEADPELLAELADAGYLDHELLSADDEVIARAQLLALRMLLREVTR